MGREDRGWRALERIARGLNAATPESARKRDLALELSRRAVSVAARVGVRAMDRVVGRLAGRAIDTTPREPRTLTPAAEITSRAALHFEESGAPPFEPAVEPTPVLEPAPAPAEHATARPKRAAPSDEPEIVAPPVDQPLPSLPPRYGIDRVVLVAGESEFVFAYWETDPSRLQSAAKAELRLLGEDGRLVERAYVDPVQGRQHLRVPSRGARYHAELVLLDGSSDGYTISRSREVVVRVPEAL